MRTVTEPFMAPILGRSVIRCGFRTAAAGRRTLHRRPAAGCVGPVGRRVGLAAVGTVGTPRDVGRPRSRTRTRGPRRGLDPDGAAVALRDHRVRSRQAMGLESRRCSRHRAPGDRCSRWLSGAIRGAVVGQCLSSGLLGGTEANRETGAEFVRFDSGDYSGGRFRGTIPGGRFRSGNRNGWRTRVPAAKADRVGGPG